jgi:hypothetical protein
LGSVRYFYTFIASQSFSLSTFLALFQPWIRSLIDGTKLRLFKNSKSVELMVFILL